MFCLGALRFQDLELQNALIGFFFFLKLRSFCTLKEQKFVRYDVIKVSARCCQVLLGWRKELSIILPLMTPDGSGSTSMGPVLDWPLLVDVLAWRVCVRRDGRPLQIYNRAAVMDFSSRGGDRSDCSALMCCCQVARGNWGA